MRAGHDIDLSAPPFDLLTRAQADRLRAATDVEFFPRGATVLEVERASPAAYVILKGHVTAFDRDGSGRRVFAEFGPGDLFGTTAAITGAARYTYEAMEDTLVYTIPAAIFRSTVEENGRLATYFLASLSRKSRLLDGSTAPASDIGELMLTRAADAGLAPAVRVSENETIAEATRRMREARVDCVFVDRAAGVGIATRTDLLDGLALEQHALTDPVAMLASWPVIGIDATQPLFEALVTMTRHGIERVAVFDDAGTLLGSLGMAEVLSHYSSHSHVIGLEIARATDVNELAQTAQRLTTLVRTLHATGARMRYLTELLSALNARLIERLFTMCFTDATGKHVCLLTLGSEGRGEQILKTDQDNALVSDGAIDEATIAEAARAFSEGLARLGYPRCPGGVMVSNPAWRGSSDRWVSRISDLARDFSPAAQLQAAIIVDATPVAGRRELFEPLRAAMRALGRNELWLHHFVRPAIEFHTPLTLFGGLPGRKVGVDIKKGGIFPLVHGLRTMALEAGVPQTNSFERAGALKERGDLSEELADDLEQALAVMLRLRLGQQLAALRAGETPGNEIPPATLRRSDRDLLRDALRIVHAFQAVLRARYHHGI